MSKRKSKPDNLSFSVNSVSEIRAMSDQNTLQFKGQFFSQAEGNEKGAAINVCLETVSGSSSWQARKNSVKSLFCVRAFAPFYSISKHGISNFT